MLGRAAQHEEDCGSQRGVRQLAGGVFQSVAGGRRVALLKVLQSSYCSGRCHYCAFRASRDVPRFRLGSDELARHFLALRRAGLVEGLFLSSGIHGSADRTMARMVDTVELVRRAGFSGYVHLKVLPGASDAAVERAVQVADRISINLEAPTDQALEKLGAGAKLGAQLMGPLRAAARMAERGGARAGITTQFVVGAAGESDGELLAKSSALYQEGLVRRCYFSRFAPPDGGPLAGVAPAAPERTVRLYQADWLLRHYDFQLEEIPLAPDGQLDRCTDPKTLWARQHPERFPVEINQASAPDLLRVPGLGPTGVRRILSVRRRDRLRSPRDLGALGVRWREISRYVTFDGRHVDRSGQLELPLGL